MIRGYKIRIYPTKKQESLIWEHINACRFIWNWMLDYQIKARENGEKHLSAYDMMKLLTPLKKEEDYAWLRKVSNTSLQRTCRDLHEAYLNFFRKTHGFPKFKSKKHSKAVYPIRTDVFRFENGYAIVEKIGKLRYKTDYDLPQGRVHGIGNQRVSFVNGKWILSFCMECENQTFQLTNKPMGIDLGIKNLAVVEYGGQKIVYHNINKSSKVFKLENRIRYLHKAACRKYEKNRQGNKYFKTNNIVKIENRMRKLYAHLANIRTNYVHQTTHALVTMLPSKVVMETLDVVGMMTNKHMSKAVREQYFYLFRRQMQYKCERYSVPFVLADRFFPSSKTCSCCGNIKHNLKLSDRVYVCDECGLTIDRDYNAAVNLSRYAV